MRIEQIEKIGKQISKIQKQYEKAKALSKKMDREAETDLKQIARISIDKYYESYTPEYYDREYDLYNIFDISISSTRIAVDYDFNKLTRHEWAKRKYLFDYMFMQGYHGGDTRGPGHPAPGIPWYRGTSKDSNTFAFWTVPAVQTDSPYEEIEYKSQQYIDDFIEKYNEQIIEPLNMSINKLIDLMK